MSKVVAAMSNVLACPYDPQRIMAAAFFSEVSKSVIVITVDLYDF